MFRVRNRLNQALTIGEYTIAAGGSLELTELTADFERMEKNGHIRINREASKETNAVKKAEAAKVADLAKPVSVPPTAPAPVDAKADDAREKK